MRDNLSELPAPEWPVTHSLIAGEPVRGYLFGKPLERDALVQWIRERARAP